MATTTDEKLHIAMFPWLAFGHIIPFLELAKLIAQKGHKISFISTPRNIDRLPKLPPQLSTLIDFASLPLPHVPHLLAGAEATSDVPLCDVRFLEVAFDLLQQPFFHLLQSSLPDWVLFDFSPFWVPDLAHKLNIPCAYVSIFTAACNCFMSPPSGEEDYRRVVEDYTLTPRWVPFPSTVAWRRFEAVKCLPSARGEDNNVAVAFRFEETLKRCDLIAVRTCPELESDWLDLIHQIHKKPVIPIGIFPPQTGDRDPDDKNETWKSIKNWLDKQEKGTVVYIAFGSEAKPSQEELTEIALGLELSGLPFIWVLRKRRGAADTEVVELPDGFEERTKDRGLVFTSWAPQLKILSHDSVGGFLSHSGWSSVVEALQFGKALVFLTFFADQGLNAKLLVEKEMGYLIPRDENDGSFTRDAVAVSVRMVVVEEGGRVYREKAEEMRGLFGDRDRQDRYVDEFLSQLKSASVFIQ